MIPLLIGAACFIAAWRTLMARTSGNAWQREFTGFRAAAWVGVIAGLVLFQLWLRADDIARYRFTLAGLRFAITDDQDRPLTAPLRVSGDYDEADLYIPGAGDADVARLRPTGDSAGSVLIDLPADAGAIALVEERRPLGRSRWRIPDARQLLAGDTVVITARGAVHRLVVRVLPDTLTMLGLRLPIPWADRHAIAVAAVGEGAVAGGAIESRSDHAESVGERAGGAGPTAGGPGTGRVVLPSSGIGFAHRLRGARPSFFARSYPLADVVAALDTAAVWGLPPLTSFFFYDGDRLFLADVDSEVEIAGAAPNVVRGSSPPRLERGGRTGRRILVAAMPLRDYPELRLALPERYGIRPLRTVSLAVRGEWLDATFAHPEVQALDRAALEEIRLPAGSGDSDAYRIRVSHARNPLVRQAVVFESPSRLFAAASQGVLTLDQNPRAQGYDLVTPAGLAHAQTGRPVPLGSRERSILLRVDGQATSPGFWLVHLALFLLAGSVFYFRRLPAPVFTLAIAAVGFGALRVLLGVSATLEPPFVQEAHQIGLWLVPVLPWAVVLAAEAARAGRLRGFAFHVVYALAVATVTLVVFADSPAKQLVLTAVPLLLLAFAARRGFPASAQGSRLAKSARTGARPAEPSARRKRVRAVVSRHVWGWSLGAALLLLRVLFDLIGWREGIMLGGTRIAVSVLYTPLALATLAFVLHRHGRRIAVDASRRAVFVARAYADVAAFLLLAFVGTSFWISDFGIVLVGLPGVLLLLLLVATRWTRGLGAAAAASAALPLVLFILIQAAPAVLQPVWGASGQPEGRMGEWNRNELLLLERGDPHALRRIGQRRSEALAVMRETMRSYTRGNWFGKGFLNGRVSPEIQETATREHLVSALLASQWGAAGVGGLVALLTIPLLLLGMTAVLPGASAARPVARLGAVLFGGLYIPSLVLPAPFGALFVGLASSALLLTFWLSVRHADAPAPAADDRPADIAQTEPPPFNGLLAALLLLTFSCAGLYMVLANYGLAFFTGKNVYLLGLDSVSDALEGAILLAGGAAALSWGRPAPAASEDRALRPVPRRLSGTRHRNPVVTR